MIHSSNSILRSWGGRGCIFFLEEICVIGFGLFDSKIEQLLYDFN